MSTVAIVRRGDCLENAVGRRWRCLLKERDVEVTVVGDVVRVGPAVAQHWPNGASGCGNATHGANDDRRTEYHSTCAIHSHVHIEGFGADSVIGRGAALASDTRLMTYTVAPAIEPRATPMLREAMCTRASSPALAGRNDDIA